MTSNEKYDLGMKAEKLLANDAFNAALKNIRERNFEKFCRLDVDDIDAMKKINAEISSIDCIENELKDLILTGNKAKKNIRG